MSGLAQFYFGPNVMRGEGVVLYLAIAPRPDLMHEYEEGRLVLVGFELKILVHWPWRHIRGRALSALNGYARWRSPVALHCRSDSAEISARIYANALCEGRAA